MSKHAYLIMAHNKFQVLCQLLRCIDDERNDIYIHIDSKVGDFDFDYYKNICKKAKIFFTHKRLDVKWGHCTQVKLEMMLFKTAVKGNYERYHLISGVDLPIKTQDEIHAFFDGNNEEFINFVPVLSHWDYFRLSRFHFSDSNKRIKRRIIYEIFKLQDKFKVDRFKKYGLEFYRGGNWCSLTHECVLFIISKEKLIKKLIPFTSCADECYKQIIIGNSKFINNCSIGKDQTLQSLRYVKWEMGKNSPEILTVKDSEDMMSSGCLFARKFDDSVDREIIEKTVSLVAKRI